VHPELAALLRCGEVEIKGHVRQLPTRAGAWLDSSLAPRSMEIDGTRYYDVVVTETGHSAARKKRT
jgi:hypothetical protein